MKTLNDSIVELKEFLNGLHETDSIPYNVYSDLFDLVDGLNEHVPQEDDDDEEIGSYDDDSSTDETEPTEKPYVTLF